jgi:uncharacterized protein (TIGR02246 family)
MSRTTSTLIAGTLTAVTLCAGGRSQDVRRDGVASAGAGAASQSVVRSDEERAIREAIDAFSRAFQRGDARAIAGQFAEDGEAIDPEGNAIQGRQALEEHYAARMAGAQGDKLDVTVEKVARLAPGIARVTGRTQVAPSDGSAPIRARFAGIFIQRDGRWLLASVREIADKELSPHDHLAELEWLVGDWVEETEEAVIETSVGWTDNGNFLVRSFDVRVKGKPALTGTQRIGWDPLTKQLKSWVFDSNGGYGEGLWMREGEQWIIKATGVRSDGRVATATQVLTRVNKDTLRWKSIDRTLGSEISQDIDEIVMVRKPPRPAAK